MGMYDYVNFEMKCPICKTLVADFHNAIEMEENGKVTCEEGEVILIKDMICIGIKKEK
jgi:hypothetical protein